MKVWIRSIVAALADLKQRPLQTSLSALGILIGIWAVVMLQAVGTGLENYLTKELSSLGADTIYVLPGDIFGGNAIATASQRPLFTEADVRSLGRLVGVERVVPTQTKRATLRFGGEEKFTDMLATTEAIFELRNLELESGRFFDNSDVISGNEVAVIGPELAEALYGNSARAIGRHVELDSYRLEVIGVVEAQGGVSLGGPNYDAYAYVPYSSAKVFMGTDKFYALYVQAKKGQDLSEVKEQIEEALSSNYEIDEFTVVEPEELLNAAGSILGTVQGVLLGIGSISLVVGGVGIMNIMYATVSERIKEIGIRRALGATAEDIARLFMVEAVLLSLFGAVTAVLLAYGLVLVVSYYFPLEITLGSLLTGIGVSSLIGVVFGAWPARKAASLPPAEAIRYE